MIHFLYQLITITKLFHTEIVFELDTHNVTYFIVTKVPETTSGYAYILLYIVNHKNAISKTWQINMFI